MKTTEFCYWLQGLFELADPTELDAKQTEMIKKHLALVFYHDIDPSYPKDQQEDLNKIHNSPDTQQPILPVKETDFVYPTYVPKTNGGDFIMRC